MCWGNLCPTCNLVHYGGTGCRVKMKLSLLAVMLTFAVYLGTAEGPAVPIAYRVTPEMKEGALAALDVEIRFNGNSEGVTRLHLPDEFAGQSELWRQVADLTVEG